MDLLCGNKPSPNPDGHGFVLQTTPSSRSTCHSCEEAIQLGSVRFGIWSTHDELKWLKIWKFRHVGCVTSSEIEQALAVYDTIEGIPTLIKQGLGGIPQERREGCDVVLSCTLNDEPKPEGVVQGLNANPDQHVWDLLEDAKSRRVRTPGSKKKDKFDAAKAAIESVRDKATGHFDVDEALAALTAKKPKNKPRAKIKAHESGTKKQKPRKRKAEIKAEAEQPRPPTKRRKTKKANKASKAKQKGGSSANNSAGENRPSPQAGGGAGGASDVKEEETEDGTGTVDPAAATSSSDGTGPASNAASNTASSPAVAAAAAAAGVKVEATSGHSSGVADSEYTGPRTRSRSKRSRS